MLLNLGRDFHITIHSTTKEISDNDSQQQTIEELCKISIKSKTDNKNIRTITIDIKPRKTVKKTETHTNQEKTVVKLLL
jgi:hypothetical protein